MGTNMMDKMHSFRFHIRSIALFLRNIYSLGVDVARDGSSVHDLPLDSLVAHHSAVLRQRDLGVALNRVAANFRVMIAGHADVHRSAITVLCLVLLAGHVGDGVDVDPAECRVYVAAATGARSAAVEQHLNGRNHIPLSAVGQYLDPVSNSRCSCMCPARTTTLNESQKHESIILK